jgi:Arc/MetJ-type ribon-helix-helix transcriptional regulator
MTIHLPDDLARYIHAKVESGQFADEDAAVAEAVRRFRQWDQEQSGEASEGAATTPPSDRPGRKPLWERVEEMRKSVPAEEWAKVPADGAAQLDHYLYGAPKRPTS